MHYYKNVELTKLYPVSEKAVRNWIEGAAKGKINLRLIDVDGKQYIANTAQNQSTIEELIERGKKYRNSLVFKQIDPTPLFYTLYNRRHIFDIISNIEVHREIPFKYTYFNGGALLWDKLAKRMEKEQELNSLKYTLELMTANLANIDRLLGNAKRVNIIDLGPGNGRPTKELVEHLHKRGILNRYIALDISEEMLDIAERNFHNWFGGEVRFEKYVRDLDYDRFKDLLVDDYLSGPDRPINLVLLLGGTLANTRVPEDTLRIISSSMSAHDILLYSKKVDTLKTRQYFDFNVNDQVEPLGPQAKLFLESLGIEPALYDVENKFDPQKCMRVSQIRLKLAIALRFAIDGSTYQVELNKGDSILMWRAHHATPLDIINQFADNGFDLLNASLSTDHSYFLSLSDVKGARFS